MDWEKLTSVAVTIKCSAFYRVHLACWVMSCAFSSPVRIHTSLENTCRIRELFSTYSFPYGLMPNYHEQFMHWLLRFPWLDLILFCIWYDCCDFCVSWFKCDSCGVTSSTILEKLSSEAFISPLQKDSSWTLNATIVLQEDLSTNWA